MKAGPDGVSVGDCPFAHSVQIALRLKGIDFDVVPCTQETKPKWLIDEVGGKMPCVCHDGVPHVETKDILAWIDTEFPEPPLALPASASDALQKDFGLFPAIAAYTKSTDSTEEDEMLKVNVQMKIASLRAHLSGVIRGDFVCGTNPTLADCRIFPALYILKHATSHYKGFGLEVFPEGDDVREYFARCMAFEPVKASCYPGDVCVWGWGQARGAK